MQWADGNSLCEVFPKNSFVGADVQACTSSGSRPCFDPSNVWGAGLAGEIHCQRKTGSCAAATAELAVAPVAPPLPDAPPPSSPLPPLAPPPPPTPTTVTSSAELDAALADTTVHHILVGVPRIEPSSTIVINRTLTIEAVGYDNGATATLDAAQRFRVMEVLPPEQVPGIVCSSGSCSYDQGCPCVALQGNHTTHPPIYEPIEVRLRGLVLTGGYTAGGYIPGSWQQTWGCPDVPCVGWSYAFEGGAALRTYGGSEILPCRSPRQHLQHELV